MKVFEWAKLWGIVTIEDDIQVGDTVIMENQDGDCTVAKVVFKQKFTSRRGNRLERCMVEPVDD